MAFGIGRDKDRVDDGHAGELRDKGFVVEQASKVLPIIGIRCPHDARDLEVTAKGHIALMVRCKRCQRVGPFVPIPERELNSAETDLLVKLAREASWKGRIA